MFGANIVYNIYQIAYSDFDGLILRKGHSMASSGPILIPTLSFVKTMVYSEGVVTPFLH